jgi:nitrogen fixation protein FixH
MNIFPNGRFTGWHITSILVAFFGIVIAVNLYMARMAVGTFGGTVVDNSYVASQNYNRWLAAADKQDRLGWTVKSSLTPDRFVTIDAQRDGQPLQDATAVGEARHVLGRAGDIALEFKKASDGQLVSTTALPAGRWNVMISVRQGADIYKLLEQPR